MRKFHISEGAIMPVRATKESAGYDLCVINPEVVTIKPGQTKVFDTGVSVEMNPDEVFMIYIRSSVGLKRNLILSNSVPIIDADFYPNEFKLAVTNVGEYAQIIDVNERIAQGIFMKYLVTDDDNATGVRDGGIGSTNKEEDEAV